MPSNPVLLKVLGGTGLLLFSAAFAWAAAYAYGAAPVPRDLARQALTVIGPALATFVGAQIGIETMAGRNFRRLFAPLDLRALATWIYVLGLIAAVIVAMTGTTVLPEITAIANTLIGFCAGALAIILSVEPRQAEAASRR